MLSASEFDRATVVIVENIHYEVIRPKGHPMVMYDAANGTPVASVRFHSASGSSFISARPDNDQSAGLGGRFQGVTNESGQHFAFVLTNLLFHEPILINVRKRDPSNPDGPGKLVNEINVIKPGVSIRVNGDFSADNGQFLLDTILKKQEDGGEAKPMDVGADERNGLDAATGAYFYVTVAPTERSERDWSTATWGCPDLFCRPRDANEAMNTYDVTRFAPVFGRGWNGEAPSHRRRFRGPRLHLPGDPPPRDDEPQDMIGDFERSQLEGGMRYFSAGLYPVNSGPFATLGEALAQGSGQGFGSGGSGGGWGSSGRPTPAAASFSFGAPAPEAARWGAPEPTPPRRTSPVLGTSPPLSPSYSPASSGDEGEEHEQGPRAMGMANPVTFNPLNGTSAAEVRHGDVVRVESQKVAIPFNYKVKSAPCMLGLSVLKDNVTVVPQLSKAEAFSLGLKLVEDCVNNKNQALLATLKQVYLEPVCVVCIENLTSVILLKCGHQCLCETCAGNLVKKECPVCRGHIVAEFHVVPEKE